MNRLSDHSAHFTISDIATDALSTCKSSDAAAAILTKSEFLTFDHIPVIDEDEQIIGVLERAQDPGSAIAEVAMRRLNGSMLLSAHAPLLDGIRSLAYRPYALVVYPDGIHGIITRSDVQKLPVRMLIFSSVTILEQAIADAIIVNKADGTWIDLIPKDEIKNMERLRMRLVAEGMDPSIIVLVNFFRKIEIVARILGLSAEENKGLHEIRRLRNATDHGDNFLNSRKDIAALFELLDAGERWIAFFDEEYRRNRK